MLLAKHCKTFTAWKTCIRNHLTYEATNGPMGGISNKTLKQWTYGYRNMEHFTVRIRLECSEPRRENKAVL